MHGNNDIMLGKLPPEGGSLLTRIKNIIKELRIIPKGRNIGYLIDLVYYKEVKKINNLDKESVAGLDFGLRNIVTIGNNIGVKSVSIKSVSIKGGVLKSINQFYNKKLAIIRSTYSMDIIACQIKDKKDICRKTGPAIQILTNNRNKKIKDVMHKYSRYIIDYCIKHNIGTIVIGHNDNWKQDINLGKRNNQNFVHKHSMNAVIPFYTFIKMIKYKGEEIGIEFIEKDESHTSKCSFLDDESVEHHNVYVGKRISRGIFRSAKGILINADVQGALNTIKKAIPKAFSKEKVDRIEMTGLHPLIINPLKKGLVDYKENC